MLSTNSLTLELISLNICSERGPKLATTAWDDYSEFYALCVNINSTNFQCWFSFWEDKAYIYNVYLFICLLLCGVYMCVYKFFDNCVCVCTHVCMQLDVISWFQMFFTYVWRQGLALKQGLNPWIFLHPLLLHAGVTSMHIPPPVF